ncbi:helix-turn-helix domain-containing protein [Levilactobacillus brevis]|nr:helix-turn-helix domain-containing protein [Levilactobacillus brevis]
MKGSELTRCQLLRLRKGGNVTTDALLKMCKAVDCNMSD